MSVARELIPCRPLSRQGLDPVKLAYNPFLLNGRVKLAAIQHCRTSDLEPTVTCCVKLRLPLSTFKSRLKIRFYCLLSLRQHLCGRLTALWRFINFVLLLLLLLLFNRFRSEGPLHAELDVSSRNHHRYSLHLPTEGWPGRLWIGFNE